MLPYGFCIKCEEVRTARPQHFISTISSVKYFTTWQQPGPSSPNLSPDFYISTNEVEAGQLDKAVGWQWQWIIEDELYISPRTSQDWVVTTIKSSPVAFTPSTIMAITWHLEPSHYTATLTPISLSQTQVINNKSMIHFQKFSEWMRIWLIIPARACWLAFLGEINFILSTVGWDAIAAVGRVWVDINFPKTFKIFITQSISG